jgi:pyridine nucleotide-disulfide oxidoreductase family protein
VKRILLIGAGHAHLAVLRALAEEPLHGARITLVSPSPSQIYSGMLPGVIAGHYWLEEAQIDVASLVERAYGEFVQGEVAGLDLKKRTARLRDWNEIQYDFASLNAGSLVDTSVPGAREHALPVKPFNDFIHKLGNPRRIALAGAGVAGAELAMALRHAGAAVTLYSDQPTVAPALAQRLVRAMRRRRVDFRPGMPVTAIEPGPVVISGTSQQEFDRVLLTTGAVPQRWLRSSGLATDERGFALVNATLQSVSHPEIFAVGDCATLQPAPHPKSGVYAVRHGEVLAQSLRNLVEGKPPVSYEPQPRALSLISCGGRYAIAEWGPRTAEGHLLWWWKNLIDRRWIKSLSS